MKKKKQKKKTRSEEERLKFSLSFGERRRGVRQYLPKSIRCHFQLAKGGKERGREKGFGSKRKKKKKESYGLGSRRERAVWSIFPQEGCRGAGLTVSETSNASVPLTAAVRLSVSSCG